MHLIITDAWLAKSRPIHLTGSRLVLSGLALALALMVVVAGLYHWVFLEGARQGWPVVGSLVSMCPPRRSRLHSKMENSAIASSASAT